MNKNPSPWPLETGDQATTAAGAIALVWDGRFQDQKALVKFKYIRNQGKMQKLPSAFSAAWKYQQRVGQLGLLPAAQHPAVGVLSPAELVSVAPSRPLGEACGEGPSGPLLELLQDAGIVVAKIRVTGSRALGIHRPDSDWDLIVPVWEEQIPQVRETLCRALERGELNIPEASNTWRRIDQLFPGGGARVVESRRFAETVQSGNSKVAMIFVEASEPAPALGPDWECVGRAVFQGVVRDSRHSAFKRAGYVLETRQGPVHGICYHKLGNLLREGDQIVVAGWHYIQPPDRHYLVQFYPEPDLLGWQCPPTA